MYETLKAKREVDPNYENIIIDEPEEKLEEETPENQEKEEKEEEQPDSKKPKTKQSKVKTTKPNKTKDKKAKQEPAPKPVKQHAIYNPKKLYIEVLYILHKCKEKYPQYDLNGLKNMWILKPSGLSRGRGICMFDNLKEI